MSGNEELESDVDIYSDLPNFQYDESIQTLESKVKSLEEKVSKLTCELDRKCKMLTEAEKKLSDLNSNMSSLYKTAKLEIERKDRMIESLNKRLDDIAFRRADNSYNRKKLPTIEERSSEEQVKSGSQVSYKYDQLNNVNIESESKVTSYNKDTLFSARTTKKISENRKTDNVYCASLCQTKNSEHELFDDIETDSDGVKLQINSTLKIQNTASKVRVSSLLSSPNKKKSTQTSMTQVFAKRLKEKCLSRSRSRSATPSRACRIPQAHSRRRERDRYSNSSYHDHRKRSRDRDSSHYSKHSHRSSRRYRDYSRSNNETAKSTKYDLRSSKKLHSLASSSSSRSTTPDISNKNKKDLKCNNSKIENRFHNEKCSSQSSTLKKLKHDPNPVAKNEFLANEISEQHIKIRSEECRDNYHDEKFTDLRKPDDSKENKAVISTDVPSSLFNENKANLMNVESPLPSSNLKPTVQAGKNYIILINDNFECNGIIEEPYRNVYSSDFTNQEKIHSNSFEKTVLKEVNINTDNRTCNNISLKPISASDSIKEDISKSNVEQPIKFDSSLHTTTKNNNSDPSQSTSVLTPERSVANLSNTSPTFTDPAVYKSGKVSVCIFNEHAEFKRCNKRVKLSVVVKENDSKDVPISVSGQGNIRMSNEINTAKCEEKKLSVTKTEELTETKIDNLRKGTKRLIEEHSEGASQHKRQKIHDSKSVKNNNISGSRAIDTISKGKQKADSPKSKKKSNGNDGIVLSNTFHRKKQDLEEGEISDEDDDDNDNTAVSHWKYIGDIYKTQNSGDAFGPGPSTLTGTRDKRPERRRSSRLQEKANLQEKKSDDSSKVKQLSSKSRQSPKGSEGKHSIKHSREDRPSMENAETSVINICSQDQTPALKTFTNDIKRSKSPSKSSLQNAVSPNNLDSVNLDNSGMNFHLVSESSMSTVTLKVPTEVFAESKKKSGDIVNLKGETIVYKSKEDINSSPFEGIHERSSSEQVAKELRVTEETEEKLSSHQEDKCSTKDSVVGKLAKDETYNKPAVVIIKRKRKPCVLQDGKMVTISIQRTSSSFEEDSRNDKQNDSSLLGSSSFNNFIKEFIPEKTISNPQLTSTPM